MRDFQAIEKRAYDLIVIGGGINGAGVARDAALRGLKVILLEKGDFASGTTSWSTRLVHGGLRYLEYFEFDLVRESLREREILLRTAPHLVRPILMTIPIYRDRSRPYWKIQAGMLLYDTLSLDKSLVSHRMLPREKFRQHFRSLDPEGLIGGAQYYDGQVERAERLCWENVLSARERGATVLNYVKVERLDRDGRRIARLQCRDELTGKTFAIAGHAKTAIVNTAGPWVDRVCRSGSPPIGDRRKIGGTKGSHIVVDCFSGAPDGALYVEAKTDGRPFFIVPWLGMYLIGTTDRRYDGPLDGVKIDSDEIDYLLRETNLIIPTARLSRNDVKFTYSGVRPLPYREKKSTGSITRRHIWFDHGKEGADNMLSLIGGKLTTYRHVAEEAANWAYRQRGETPPPCPTIALPLPGAILPTDRRILEAIEANRDRLSASTIAYLFATYGAKALEVLAIAREEPELAEPILPELPDIKAQVVYAARSEMAEAFTDIARRRTAIAMQANYGLDALPVLSDLLGRYCGWSPERCRAQTEAYHRYVEENCIPDYARQSAIAIG